MATKENNKDVFLVAEGGSLEGLASKVGGYLQKDVLFWNTFNFEDIEGRVVDRKVRNKKSNLDNPHVSCFTHCAIC
jgi:hypothetical protein